MVNKALTYTAFYKNCEIDSSLRSELRIISFCHPGYRDQVTVFNVLVNYERKTSLPLLALTPKTYS